MNICNDNEEVKDTYKHPELIGGHLYKRGSSAEIYIYCRWSKYLVSLSDGNIWDNLGGIGTDTSIWQDVTDQYCLKKVK